MAQMDELKQLAGQIATLKETPAFQAKPVVDAMLSQLQRTLTAMDLRLNAIEGKMGR